MAKTVTPEAFKAWSRLHHKARVAWELVGRSAQDYQSGKIDAEGWSGRIRRAEEVQRELQGWQGRYLERTP